MNRNGWLIDLLCIALEGELKVIDKVCEKIACDDRTFKKMQAGERCPKHELRVIEVATECLDQATLERCRALTIPIYDTKSSYEHNLKRGPRIDESVEHTALDIPRCPTHLFGREVNSRFGPSASCLTPNSRWVLRMAGLGSDVLTYKSVRHQRRKAHDIPHNIGYLAPGCADATVWIPGAFPPTVEVVDDHKNIPAGAHVILCNCLGGPSEGPEEWTRDVARCVQRLGPGKCLIVSVMGTISFAMEDAADRESILISSIIECVQHIVDLPRHHPAAIEINLSCPNTYPAERVIADRFEMAREVCRQARAVIAQSGVDVRLLVKISYMDAERLERFVAATSEYLDGYSAINTIPVEAVKIDDEGRRQPFFGSFPRGGVSGVAIRDAALDTVRRLSSLLLPERSRFTIVGMGGVTNPVDVQRFIDAGADAVQATTVFFHDPGFAVSVRRYLASLASPEAVALAPDEAQRRRNNLAELVCQLSPAAARYLVGTRLGRATGGESELLELKEQLELELLGTGRTGLGMNESQHEFGELRDPGAG